MIPTEQAKELLISFRTKLGREYGYKNYKADIYKQCALIVVDEIIAERFDYRQQATQYNNKRMNYWREVRKEIEKL